VNLQEVGLLYNGLEYNDKLLLLHLSDTMRDIEFFRQNIIGDALATVQKTQNARIAWLNLSDSVGNSQGGSGVHNNAVSMFIFLSYFISFLGFCLFLFL
jgi:hypothetical protein